ncbi:hypothetical protein TSUD_197800 [Trifolium subterraneum]|uniref:PPM-type phosphatase domain-containing protein n=1 Tax=Trifolium subterraneum TaxID=3900 RepID=A0A2Z6MHJ4_TRISU|nr:hypothetical protein TSUD_197800 [Trifolium subterraneum]
MLSPEGEIKISFGYKCNSDGGIPSEIANGYKNLTIVRRASSFSCLSGAAISANATLANTNICNGKISDEILPSWDSPNSFRRVPSSPSFSRFDRLSSSLPNSLSYLSSSPSTTSDSLEYASDRPSTDGFLIAKEVQVAGGAAGEDRVQAVCSEENGWLFCAIYDGFNGRDAADFLAGTLYETIISYLDKLIWELEPGSITTSNHADLGEYLRCKLDDSLHCHEDHSLSKSSRESFSRGVLDSLDRALSQAENDFLYMVEQEMGERPDLVSIGSCVLLLLLHGNDLYTLNLGDSRAVLATCSSGDGMNKSERLKAIQLTDSHTVDNEAERTRLVADHPDDPKVVIAGKVKVGSDGLFDFFSNEEAVNLVESYILTNPFGDPAKFLIEQLVARAADSAGFSMEELMNVPAGRRRKYHDDVTVMVIMLGMNQRTSKASTCI